MPSRLFSDELWGASVFILLGLTMRDLYPYRLSSRYVGYLDKWTARPFHGLRATEPCGSTVVLFDM